MSDLFLTDAELVKATEATRPALQEEVLRKNGLVRGRHYMVTRRGHVRLYRAVVLGADAPAPDSPGAEEPDLEAVRALG